MPTPAILVLADGSVFKGFSIGIEGKTVGEVVFNTSMTGYQEMLTDPSYCQQILTLTYPHIGNVGCNKLDEESQKIYAAGLIIRDLSAAVSNWRAEMSLSDYLRAHHTVAIAEIDTRRLTRLLREKGAQHGCIMAGHVNVEKALSLSQAFKGLAGADLAQTVTTLRPYTWLIGEWQADTNTYLDDKHNPRRYRVVAYDFGIKKNILRCLAAQGCEITVVPAKTSAEEALALNPQGIFLSNGPGDPEPCDYAIQAIKTFLDKNIPIFGICLGHQLLGLAAGAKTIKMKFGHHGANHPVQDLETKKVFITSQNHGFAIDEATLPAHVLPTHRSLFDHSLQGIRLKDKPAFGFQGHPEASPGPHEMSLLFHQFINSMKE